MKSDFLIFVKYGRVVAGGAARAMRSPRRFFIAALLAVAAVMGADRHAAYAVDPFCAKGSVSDGCDNLRLGTEFAFSLPGIADDLRFDTSATQVLFVEKLGSGTAKLTGILVAFVGFPAVPTGLRFEVEINMSGRVESVPLPFQPLDSFCYTGQGDPVNWHGYTSFVGELRGLPGEIYDGAVYELTRRNRDVQVGFAAANNEREGAFAELTFELIVPNGNDDIPVAPLDGIMVLELVSAFGVPFRPECLPPPTGPNLTGTWQGTIDCVGYDSVAGDEEAVAADQSFPNAILKLKRDPLGLFNHYSVLLENGPPGSSTVPPGAGAEGTPCGSTCAFCANMPNDPGSTDSGQGLLTDPRSHAGEVFLKYRGEEITGRQILDPTRLPPAPYRGLGGVKLCKWRFMRTATSQPAIANVCPSNEIGDCFETLCVGGGTLLTCGIGPFMGGKCFPY